MIGSTKAIGAAALSHACFNYRRLKQIYFILLPFALYFCLSRSAQSHWPLVADRALLIDVTIGGLGVLAFFLWWPIALVIGNSPFAAGLCRLGLKSILWAVYLMPLTLLFEGIKRLSEGPIFF